MPNINLSILNQKSTPAFFADTLANRPAPSFVGRVFISTDTYDLYRDTGSAWVLLSPSATGGVTGSGSTNSIAFWNGTSSITYDVKLTYNSTTDTLFVGDAISSSGKLIVNNSGADDHIVVIGANAPSFRINNGGVGATQRIGFGLSTSANNFIQGSAAGDMCVFNSSTTASPILFGIWNGVNTQEAARISASRNFLVGQTNDTGEKLQVTGNAIITGTLSATTISKTGGSSTTLMATDGSTITAGTGITISGGQISASGGSGVTGSGTIGTIPLWFGASTNIGNSQITQATSNIFIGGSYGQTAKLNVAGDIDANGNIKKNGTTVLDVGAFYVPIGNVAVGQTLVNSSIIDDGNNVYIGTATFVPRTTFASAQLVMNGSATTTNTINSLYLTSCAGIPTTAPSTYTNKQAIMVDRTNFRLYVYVGGSWRYAALV